MSISLTPSHTPGPAVGGVLLLLPSPARGKMQVEEGSDSMAEVKLTKDADALLCALYKSYREKRRLGQSKADAKLTGSASKIQSEIVPRWTLSDVEETCWELKRAGLLSTLDADNTVYHSSLTDDAIIYMEGRFKNGLSEFLGYLEQIKSILLW